MTTAEMLQRFPWMAGVAGVESPLSRADRFWEVNRLVGRLAWTGLVLMFCVAALAIVVWLTVVAVGS